MTENSGPSGRAASETFDPYGAVAEPGAGQTSPFVSALRVLRGRWLWALGLGATFAAAGIVSGWKLPPVLYQSSGWIEVKPSLPTILRKTEENQIHPMFDAYLESQVSLASSRRVIDMAMGSAAWRNAGGGRTDEDVAAFLQSLKVVRPTKALYVQVAYQDENPEVARVAVNAVMDAYMKIVDEQETVSGNATIRVLDNKKQALINTLNDVRDSIQLLTEDLGADGLQDRYKIAADDEKKLDGLLRELDLEIAGLEAAGLEPARTLTEAEIALDDSSLQKMIETREQMKERLRVLEKVLERGSKDLEVQARKSDLEAIQRQIDERVKTFQAASAAAPEDRMAQIAARKARRASVSALRDQQQDEVRRLGKKRGQLAGLEADRANATENLEEVKRRLEELNTEAQGVVKGRVRIASEADRPVGPFNDKRLQLMTLGGIGGMGLGLALVMLWGLRNARMRHIADVDGRASHGRFLGILPEVSEGDSPEATDAAAEMGDYCVHHIRTMVQLRSKRANRVVSITSPSPGSGKTTLALALAESFAVAGSRPLLIDCDLVGHGLSSTLRSLVCDDASRLVVASAGGSDHPKIARKHRIAELLTARDRRYDDAQFAELLESVRELAVGGDPALSRVAGTMEALGRSGGSAGGAKAARLGILGAVEGAPLADCVVELPQENLFVLPIGQAQMGDAVRLSHERLQRLMTVCRESYDAVVVDTGPILGSIEAALATSVTDSVLLIVTRGERQNLVNDALARLDEIGGDVAGLVFNRASLDDVISSKYVSHSASTPVGAV